MYVVFSRASGQQRKVGEAKEVTEDQISSSPLETVGRPGDREGAG